MGIFGGINNLPLTADSVTGYHQILMINLMPLLSYNVLWRPISVCALGLFLSHGFPKIQK